MTTDKLPDLVWEGVRYVRESALDAMTAERDALKLDRVKWRKTLMDERDSAREALAKARGYLAFTFSERRNMECQCLRCTEVRDFLAAQPGTKS